MNYPTGFNPRELDIPVEDDKCPGEQVCRECRWIISQCKCSSRRATLKCDECAKLFTLIHYRAKRKHKNYFCSKSCSAKFLSRQRMEDGNPMWKGDNVSYGALHDWVKWRLEKPDLCVRCETEKAFDLANISQQYKRDLSDWEWLCRKCHMEKDGRMKNLINYDFEPKCPKCNEANMEVEYFWKDGKRGDETGDVVCMECDYRENTHPPFESKIL